MDCTTEARKVLRMAGLALQKGRKARLEGRMEMACKLEAEGERLVKSFPDIQDDLLTSWEGSMATSPFGLMTWMIAKKNANAFYCPPSWALVLCK